MAAGLLAAGLCRGQTLVSPDYFAEPVCIGLFFPTTMEFIGANEFLVLEKNTGKVKHVANGAIVGDAASLPVANNGERGLLGIARHPNFSSNNYVYVYYSRATSLGGTFVENKVDRFVWNGSSLNFDMGIFSVPFDAGQQNAFNHNGGYMRFGPDGKLYIQVGDMGRGWFTNGRIEMNTDSNSAAGCGAIYRINDDGTTPSDNPFVSYTDEKLKKTYVYGFRNSFGMSFDPVTNKLWFTDNGPEVYDEINIAVPGGNAGWRLIMGPDYRNATYNDNMHTAYNEGDLVYLNGATYVDPIFSWLSPIGATSIEFMSSDKFGASERNHILTANTNTGRLYKFDVNANRDGFTLPQNCQDLVADNAVEEQQFTWGQNWGIVTDLRIGPDGYLYVVRFGEGEVWRIRPVQEALAPVSFSLTRGIVLSGGLPELLASDDMRLMLRPGIVFSTSEDPIQLVLETTSPFLSPSELRFTVESHANQANIQQKISLYNFSTAAYELLDTRQLPTTDTTVIVTASGDLSRFINTADRKMRARVNNRASGPVFSYPWQVRLDYVFWTVRR